VASRTGAGRTPAQGLRTGASWTDQRQCLARQISKSKLVQLVPNLGTRVPEMGAPARTLSKILFGQSRRSILALFYGHADERFFLREIAETSDSGRFGIEWVPIAET
jgi:hypothetical protein